MKKTYKRIICLLLSITLIITLFGCNSNIEIAPDETTTEIVTELTTSAIDWMTDEATISAEVEQTVEDTKDIIDSGETIDTDSISDKNLNEDIIEYEQAVEPDAIIEQENISYDGVNTGKGLKLLSKCQGRIYYSQYDSRWGPKMYSNHNDKSQTMKTSGCGPTSAAMIVSSSKGIILPTAMADLFMDNGYRTTDSGTAWSVWPFVADFFNFKDYDDTNSFSEMKKYIKQDKNKDGVPDYFIVISCASGLFTTTGHYITIMGYIPTTDTFIVYDPYNYDGKLNTPSRKRANAYSKDSLIYVTADNFKQYANAKHYWIFSNDYIEEDTKPTETISNSNNNTSYIRYVNTKSANLNVRSEPNKNAKTLRKLEKGTKITIYKTKNNYSKISKTKEEWVATEYLSKTKPTKKITYKTNLNQYYYLTKSVKLYSKSNQKGTEYNYKAQTKFKVLKHQSENEDYIYISKTGRYAYWKVSDYIQPI